MSLSQEQAEDQTVLRNGAAQIRLSVNHHTLRKVRQDSSRQKWFRLLRHSRLPLSSGLEVAAANMHGYRQVIRAVCNRVVNGFRKQLAKLVRRCSERFDLF